MKKTTAKFTILNSLILILLSFSSGINAACLTSITATTPTTDFTDNGDGSVTHNTTGLMWQRCSLGQSWNGSTCTGTATTITWAAALSAANSHAFAGYSDWRLPNRNELASIVERQCVGPAINTTLFPATPSWWYWSASPYAGHASYAWDVNFPNGGANWDFKRNYYAVRLVRGGQ